MTSPQLSPTIEKMCDKQRIKELESALKQIHKLVWWRLSDSPFHQIEDKVIKKIQKEAAKYESKTIYPHNS